MFIIKPKQNKEPIQLAASKVTFPLTSGESSDRRTSNDGDIQPTEQPWASTIMFAEIFLKIRMPVEKVLLGIVRNLKKIYFSSPLPQQNLVIL